MIEVKEGNFDDVEIHLNSEHQKAVIECPNNYDVNWMLSKRDPVTKIPYAKREPHHDPSRTYFVIPLKDLDNEQAKKYLNEVIKITRQSNREVESEKETIDLKLKLDHTETGQKAIIRFAPPDKNFAGGQVVHDGYYYVVLKQGAKDDKQYFQVVQTHKILQGREFANRMEALNSKLQVGDMKLLSFNNIGKVEVAPYVPNASQTPVKAQVQDLLTRSQKEALMAFREGNGADWKEKLLAQWNVSKYPSLSQDQSAHLQQIRNQKGPAWLLKISDKDLYLQDTRPDEVPMEIEPAKAKQEVSAKAIAVKKPAVKRVQKPAIGM